jgi:hypothetical protein
MGHQRLRTAACLEGVSVSHCLAQNSAGGRAELKLHTGTEPSNKRKGDKPGSGMSVLTEEAAPG